MTIILLVEESNPRPIEKSKRVIVRIFTDYRVLNLESVLGSRLTTLNPEIDIHLNKSGAADLVLVLNASRAFQWVWAPKNRIYKILQEPTVKSPLTHLFTYWHPKLYSRVYTHSPSPSKPREFKSHGFLGSDVALDVQGFGSLPKKTEMVSVIASTLGILSGHKKRVEFVESLILEMPHLNNHLFGRGRKKELKNKIEGLRDYRFSVAIENTAQPSYISEKFTDCIRAGVVPLYFGAPNVGEYFPRDCFIELPIDNRQKCFDIIRNLTIEDYEKRRGALLEAQGILESSFTLTSFLNTCTSEIKEELAVSPSRFRILFGLDSLLLNLSGVVGFASRFIPGFVKSRFARIVYPNL